MGFMPAGRQSWGGPWIRIEEKLVKFAFRGSVAVPNLGVFDIGGLGTRAGFGKAS